MIRIPKRREHPARPYAANRGFTLIEMMITVVVLAVVGLAIAGVMLTASRSKTSSSNSIESVQAARTALDMIAADLRSAGYGADLDWTAQPQRPIAYVDSTQVLINANLQPFPDTLVARHQPPLAYDPAGAPRPAPLNGTAWQPPIKYRSGAEVIRYSLDVNNDGVVNASDVTGTDAERTRNPNDFVLVRAVYGDSVGNLAGNNGATSEPIALVRAPGGTVPPLFTVYLKTAVTPWDWSNGPVPVAQLADIDRIVVRVDASSSRPDGNGNYSDAVLTTSVKTSRNVPDFGAATYNVDGYVYDDLNKNHVKDGIDTGIRGVSVRLGSSYTCVSSSAGYFLIKAPAGSYTLRHTPLASYGAFDSPDTVVVNLTAASTHSFADTARKGGWVSVLAFEDLNANSAYNAGEPGKTGAKVTINPGGTAQYTDANGLASFFAQAGNYDLSCTPPDSFVVVTANPVSGNMPDGGSQTQRFGLQSAATGYVKGRVFNDNNRNGVMEAGETGIQNVWVGVTPDGGVTVAGFMYTDANGDFDIQVTANNPPGTMPYYITCVIPAGKYPTGTTAIGPILLSAGQTISNNNFGVAGYQIITLNASRVLSLASGDLIEKDWNGNQTQNAHGDADILLGADAGGTDNVSVWFNQYNNTPLFDPSPTTSSSSGYTRNAPNSVLSLALDTLDTTPNGLRPDVVTGTRATASGNFFVWLTQNSGSNEGIMQNSPNRSYRTNDNGDVQAVLTLDCAGGAMPDIIAGSKSPTAGNGAFEVWQSNDGGTPAYTRQEIYPAAGAIPGNRMGEVTTMALGDLDNDGRQDLVVGTRTTSYSGEILVFRNASKFNGARFICQAVYNDNDAAYTSLTCTDVNGDGLLDIIAGTQTGTGSGTLQYWINKNNLSPIDFGLKREVDAPGLVMSVINGDFGGGTRNDIAMGWRKDETSYVGGVAIYYLDLGTLPAIGVDPSGGSVTNMVPALTSNDFNYGVKPSVPAPPFLIDLAAGLKSGPATGALVVFIR